jgi:polyisoprenoid-binding protein YceI
MIKILLCLFVLIPVYGENIYFTRSGDVSFFSWTPIEDIKANNKQVTCVLDMETGKTSFRIPIRGFTFKNGLMQEHFNESYLESEKYPNAGFNGKIENWKDFIITEKPQKVIIAGEMTIHGVTNSIKESGLLYQVNEKVKGEAVFKVMLEDYKVKIPKILIKNIAESVEIKMNLELNKK